MGKRPRYDDQYRANALIMLDGAGYPHTPGALRRVAQHLGIPERTLQRWHKGDSNPPPDSVVATVKGNVVDLLDYIVYGAAAEVKRRIDSGEIADAPLSQVMTALGIAVDKSQLLTGKPTAINEDRVSDSRDKLAQQFDRIAAIREAAEPTRYSN